MCHCASNSHSESFLHGTDRVDVSNSMQALFRVMIKVMVVIVYLNGHQLSLPTRTDSKPEVLDDIGNMD